MWTVVINTVNKLKCDKDKNISCTTPFLISSSSSITSFKFKGCTPHNSKTQVRFLMSLSIPLLNLLHTSGWETLNYSILIYSVINIVSCCSRQRFLTCWTSASNSCADCLRRFYHFYVLQELHVLRHSVLLSTLFCIIFINLIDVGSFCGVNS
jgi:hypothetical protein